MVVVPRAAFANSSFSEVQGLYQEGQYFKAARYAFAEVEQDRHLQGSGYAWITLSLIQAHLDHAATYFFIKTLQSGDKAAIRRVLSKTEELIHHVGADILRKYLIRHTHYEDYDEWNRSAYLYALAKDALLAGQEDRAIGYVNGIQSSSPLWPFAYQIRGVANAILGKNDAALEDFRSCAKRSDDVIISGEGRDSLRVAQSRREADDLKSRCIASEARTLYQMERFEEADRVYDKIPKGSFVWPDILFEQAWNAFGRSEYNRTLGKLVTYKSPALSFEFNTEIEVLRAQAYLGLCLYQDANETVNEFNGKYSRVGEEAKHFVEANSSDLGAFYDFGKKALSSSLSSKNTLYLMADRFVRGPYFQDLVISEREVNAEEAAIQQFDRLQPGVGHSSSQGFPGFLSQVLNWRMKSIRLLGGAFVKNSLIDYHSALISDFEKMAFIKLEMLKRAKEKLMNPHSGAGDQDRSRGNIEPTRRDDQYRWSFNGEFWNDELGDYVFGLESECNK